MKKFLTVRFFLLVFMILGVTSVAQAQIKFGVNAGANLSGLAGFEKVLNSASTSSSTEIKSELTIGINVGVTLRIPVNRMFFETALDYSKQGFSAKAKDDANNDDVEAENLPLHFLKLPVYLGYNFELNPDVSLTFGVGAFGAYTIAGDDLLLKDMEFKKYDFGLTAVGGVEFINHRIAVYYDHGLVDLIGLDNWSNYKKANNLPAVRNYCIKLAYTYYF